MSLRVHGENDMSKNLRKGESISLNEAARLTRMTPAQRVEHDLGRNDLTALAARFGGK